MLSSKLGKWKVGKLTKTKCPHLFCRIVYLTLWIFSVFVSREFGRAIEAQEPGRHYLLLIFTFWTSPTSADGNIHHRHSSNIRGVRCYQRYITCSQLLLAYLRPGPSFPLCRAWYSVTRPATLRAISTTVLEMDRAVCTIMKGLNATHSADLVAWIPTGFCAVFPLICCPP